MAHTLFRDAYSGGSINLYHITEEGWVHHGFNVRLSTVSWLIKGVELTQRMIQDTNPIFWKEKLEKGGFENVSTQFAEE